MTGDNFEATYQVTYLAHFLLVSHLLPAMEKSGEDCRIVFISSQTHQEADFDPDYASGAKMKKHDGFQCFANSNLFQVHKTFKPLKHKSRQSLSGLSSAEMITFWSECVKADVDVCNLEGIDPQNREAWRSVAWVPV